MARGLVVAVVAMGDGGVAVAGEMRSVMEQESR